MKNFKVVGLESFQSKKGQSITKIHTAYKDERISGSGVEVFFIMSDLVPEDICIDALVTVYYGEQGKGGFLAGIKVCE